MSTLIERSKKAQAEPASLDELAATLERLSRT